MREFDNFNVKRLLIEIEIEFERVEMRAASLINMNEVNLVRKSQLGSFLNGGKKVINSPGANNG